MITGSILVGLGFILFGYAYFAYKKETNNLAEAKKQDLVTYYLDLAYNMLPFKLWMALAGIILVLTGVVIIIVNIPLVL
ncbi:MAG TPA: hypothetical protein VHQ70_10475 [Syntrophomonadaceae bacterium]|nr:hypothetical protein [Syntrophomonadaceae bacterium]